MSREDDLNSTHRKQTSQTSSASAGRLEYLLKLCGHFLTQSRLGLFGVGVTLRVRGWGAQTGASQAPHTLDPSNTPYCKPWPEAREPVNPKP